MPANRSLEKCAYVAFIVTCVFLSTLAARRYLAERAAPQAPDAAGIGKTVASRVELGLDNADLVVFLGINSQCRYCVQSAPFYATLSRAIAGSRKRTRLVCAALESAEHTRTFLAKNGITVDAVILPPSDVPFAATPTLLMIDTSGRIRAGWTGRLSTAQEKQALAMIP